MDFRWPVSRRTASPVDLPGRHLPVIPSPVEWLTEQQRLTLHCPSDHRPYKIMNKPADQIRAPIDRVGEQVDDISWFNTVVSDHDPGAGDRRM